MKALKFLCYVISFPYIQRQNDSDESELCYGCQHFLNDAVSVIQYLTKI